MKKNGLKTTTPILIFNSRSIIKDKNWYYLRIKNIFLPQKPLYE
jgi:hypothetical protein